MSPPEDEDRTVDDAATQPIGQPDDPDEVLARIAHALDPAERRHLGEIVASAQLSHSGPLPTPSFLREYETVLPGLAERIVRMTELEQRHRHDLAGGWLAREARLRERGQALAMAALILLLGFCGLLAWLGSTKVAGGVAIATVAAVVGIFVSGKIVDASAETVGPEDRDG